MLSTHKLGLLLEGVCQKNSAILRQSLIQTNKILERDSCSQMPCGPGKLVNVVPPWVSECSRLWSHACKFRLFGCVDCCHEHVFTIGVMHTGSIFLFCKPEDKYASKNVYHNKSCTPYGQPELQLAAKL